MIFNWCKISLCLNVDSERVLSGRGQMFCFLALIKVNVWFAVSESIIQPSQGEFLCHERNNVKRRLFV